MRENGVNFGRNTGSVLIECRNGVHEPSWSGKNVGLARGKQLLTNYSL